MIALDGRPLISVITVCYNCLPKLQLTAASVLSQNLRNIEYIVVDGASSDGSSKWLSEVTDDRLVYISEPDAGVYDAMNKGIKMAGGQYLYFLGGGDMLIPGALMEISPSLEACSADMLYGDVIWGSLGEYGGCFSGSDLCHKNICHQAIFYSKSVFDTIGDFSIKYKTAADWEFNIRCFGDARIRRKHLPVKIAIFEENGISSLGDWEFDRDFAKIIIENLGLKIYLEENKISKRLVVDFLRHEISCRIKRIFASTFLKSG